MQYELRDISNVESVGIQISPEGHKVWICVNGACTLRITVPSGNVEVTDMRKKVRQKK